MAKRFSDSDLWNRDWFLNLEGRHQLFCLYLRDICDHAGVWNPAFKRFEQSTGFRVNPEEYLKACNSPESVRIIVLANGRWWITGFIEDQYKTKTMNESNAAHRGIINSLRFNNVPYLSCGYEIAPIKPLSSPLLGAKDKDKCISINTTEDTDKAIKKLTKTPIEGTCFDTFWRLYPKKVGKGYAEKVWMKIKDPGETLKSIAEALKWQTSSEPWTKENGQYIPNPATYLNGKHWLNENLKINQTNTPSYHQPYVKPTHYQGAEE